MAESIELLPPVGEKKNKLSVRFATVLATSVKNGNCIFKIM